MIHRLFGRSLRHRNDRYERAAFGFGTELNTTIDLCEQRVILAHPDVLPGMPLGAALARKDVAGDDMLAAEQFDAEAAARGIAAVTG